MATASSPRGHAAGANAQAGAFAADQLFDVALPPDGAGVDTIRHAPARVLRERRGPWQRHGQVTAFMGRIATDI